MAYNQFLSKNYMKAPYKLLYFAIFAHILIYTSEPNKNIAVAHANPLVSQHLEIKLHLDHQLNALQKTKFKAYSSSAAYILAGAPLSALGITWIVATFDVKSFNSLANVCVGTSLICCGDKFLKKGFCRLIDYQTKQTRLLQQINYQENLIQQLLDKN